MTLSKSTSAVPVFIGTNNIDIHYVFVKCFENIKIYYV